MAHIDPLPPDEHPDLSEEFAVFEEILGFVPNSLLTMQRKPPIVEGFRTLTEAVMREANEVDPGFKRLAAHMASSAAGCQYCEAHSLIAADIHGVSEEKIEALWSFAESPLYTEKERVGLEFAMSAGSVPNQVDDELMENVKAYWTDDEIVELLGAISLYGFLNRWNDTLATDLEAPAKAVGDRVLKDRGWDGGKHA